MPFRSKLVDQTVLVMNPDYGARLQLQKIVMLDLADIVVVNKSDQERAKTAMSEIERRLAAKQPRAAIALDRRQAASRRGVDDLCDLLTQQKRRMRQS